MDPEPMETGSHTSNEKLPGHAEHVETSAVRPNNLDELDSIERTRSGKFSWLVSITAGQYACVQDTKYPLDLDLADRHYPHG